MRNIAIILAAGNGLRFGNELPKQFLKVEEKMILEYSLETFQNHAQIDEIIVVGHKDFVSFLEEKIRRKPYTKLSAIVAGGKERYESSLAVIRHLKDTPECNLLFHDAVRPFVSGPVITAVLEALRKYKAVICAVQATDTIVEINPDHTVGSIPDRRMVFQAQTPQAFRSGLLRKAFEIALQDPEFRVTDDASVIFRYLPEEKIRVVPGEKRNFKITYPHDLEIMKQLLRTNHE